MKRKVIVINFFKEDIQFRLGYSLQLKRWISNVLKENKMKVENLNYIFCSDKYLKKLNKEYLGHNHFTDIITFDNSVEESLADGDIFISIDRIRANAEQFDSSFKDELHRVMIHGALHLAGFKDKSKKEKILMREAENYWLNSRRF